MLKSISNLGTVLNKSEQQIINGGQIQCEINEILVCNYWGCWCQAEYVEELPKDFDH